MDTDPDYLRKIHPPNVVKRDGLWVATWVLETSATLPEEIEGELRALLFLTQLADIEARRRDEHTLAVTTTTKLDPMHEDYFLDFDRLFVWIDRKYGLLRISKNERNDWRTFQWEFYSHPRMLFGFETYWLAWWYHRRCDGDWEHGSGVSITTIDNPGWSVQIHFRDDIDRPDRVLRDRGEDFGYDWIDCRIESGRFVGNGDPSKLDEILVCFREYAIETAGKHGGDHGL